MEFDGSVSMKAFHTHAIRFVWFILICNRLEKFEIVLRCWIWLKRAKVIIHLQCTHMSSLRLILFMRHTSDADDAFFLSRLSETADKCAALISAFLAPTFENENWKYYFQRKKSAGRVREESEMPGNSSELLNTQQIDSIRWAHFHFGFFFGIVLRHEYSILLLDACVCVCV